MAKKTDTSNIDADFIISSFESRNVASEIPALSVDVADEPDLPIKDEGRKKKPRKNTDEYQKLFVKEVSYTARLGKQICLRQEYHDRILRIIQVIGKNEVSIFSYLDNVLTHHFETYQDDITEAYNKNNPSIF